MKGDKELLELAAKAAGLNYRDGRVVYARNHLFGNEPAVVNWNPLTDDGDALRLAVSLHMSVKFETEQSSAFTTHDLHTSSNSDRFAAARRAIVRAAAGIEEARISAASAQSFFGKGAE